VIAVLRRSPSDAVTFTPIIKIGELEIEILKLTVRDGTSELHLTSLEQILLYLLAADAGAWSPVRGLTDWAKGDRTRLECALRHVPLPARVMH
jgi:DNA-binding response OmpR family regulator